MAEDNSATRADLAMRFAVPLLTLAFFAATVSGYGVFRDELYYFACARHLDWGYVDHPPLVALIAAAARALVGESWQVLRLLSALAAAATVLLVGDTAQTMGGGRWARLLAQVLAATTPIYLALFSIYSMNGFDILIWAGLVRLAVQILRGGDPRLWLAFGALAGIGLENKLDVGLLGAGLVAGLAVTRRFDVLRSRWLWLGGALAALLFLPHVLWQATHGWPTREFVTRAQEGKITHRAPWAFFGAQFLTVGPLSFAFALAGMGWLLAARTAKLLRPLGWAALAILVVLALSVSKPYYFAPALTILFPAAALALESWTAKRYTRLARAVALVAAASILFAAPLSKPLLAEDDYLRYASALGVTPGSDENHGLGRLPQYFADMHGWRELAEAVATVHTALSAAERERACVYAQNYGEAGAIDYFGPALGLPPAISGHNNYWLWGAHGCSGEPLLIIGGDREDHLQVFTSVEAGAVFRCSDCMPYEDNLTIWIARGLEVPSLAEAWPATKHFD